MQCRLMLMLRPSEHDGHSAPTLILPNLSALPLHKRLYAPLTSCAYSARAL